MQIVNKGKVVVVKATVNGLTEIFVGFSETHPLYGVCGTHQINSDVVITSVGPQTKNCFPSGKPEFNGFWFFKIVKVTFNANLKCALLCV